LATAFWEVKVLDPKWAPCLLLWLNSTYGILAYLSCATSSRGDIFKLKTGQLVEIPVPDPRIVPVGDCVGVLKRIGGYPFKRYGDEFVLAAQGKGVRYLLDRFFSEKLGLEVVSREITVKAPNQALPP